MADYNYNPDNVNFLSPHGYQFSVKKLPTTNFFVQDVGPPGLRLNPVDYPNPYTKIPYTGDHIDWETFSVTFAVDEDVKNWNEIWAWMTGNGFPEDHEQYATLERKSIWSQEGLYSDMSLMVLSSKMNPKVEYAFRDAHPISLSGFRFTSTANEIKYIVATAEFAYKDYIINRF